MIVFKLLYSSCFNDLSRVFENNAQIYFLKLYQTFEIITSGRPTLERCQ